METDDKKLIAAGGFAGLLGALCCVGPVVLVLFGLAGVSTALTIGKYTWLFTTLALLFFSIATYLYLKKKDCCSVDGVKRNWKTILISFLLLASFLVILKYWLAPLLAEIAYR